MEAILTPLIPLTYVLCLILERVFPARPLPKIKGHLLHIEHHVKIIVV